MTNVLTADSRSSLTASDRFLLDGRVVLRRGVSYAVAGGRRMRMDVARPATGGGPFPLLLVFPGNGWGYFFWFDRRACRRQILAAASRGYVAAAIDYRPASRAGFDAELSDARQAFDWLRTHAAELHADASRIGITGFSSGGQLALLLALRETKSSPSLRSAIRCVVTTAAPTDLAVLASKRMIGFAVRRLSRWRTGKRRELYRWTSTVAHVRCDMPPLLILHGTRDRFVPVEQSLLLDSALKSVDAPYRLVLTPNRGHRDQWRDHAVWRFLAAHLREDIGEVRFTRPVS